MAITSTSAAIVAVLPVFTAAERLALAGFLAGYTGLTREAYALDLRQYATWCQQRHLPLFRTRRADIECFARDLEAKGRARATGLGRAGPYERLLGNAQNGDASLFAWEDAVEAAWAVVEPVLGDAVPLRRCQPGAWGRNRPGTLWPDTAAGTTPTQSRQGRSLAQTVGSGRTG